MTETFEQAAEDVKVLKQRPGYGVLGDVYALYKQATMGDNTLTRPGFFDIPGRAKWDAWIKLKGMDKEVAKSQYIELVEKLKGIYGFDYPVATTN